MKMKKMISVFLLLACFFSFSCVSYADNDFDQILGEMSESDLNALKDAIDWKLTEVADANASGNLTDVETPSSDFLYASNGETVVIRAYKGKASVVNIPEEIDGAKVTTIAENAFKENETITAVSFPHTIEKIGEYAFYKCKKLQSVQFPKERLKSLFIDSDAFCLCDIQNPLILQADYMKVGYCAFGYIYNLPMVILLGDEIIFQGHPFASSKSLKTVYMDPQATATYDGAYDGDVFSEMDSLEEVYLPGDCNFLTEKTFVKSPYAVVYAKEGSPVLDLAKSLWIPTNSADYDAKTREITSYLESNGYIQSAAPSELDDLTEAFARVEGGTVASAKYVPGTYTAEATGMGTVTVYVTVDANGITELEIKGPGETPGIGEAAIPVLHDQVMEKQSAEVDGVTGASLTSNAVRTAVAAALEQAAAPSDKVALEEEEVPAEETADGKYVPGTYTAEATGMGTVTVYVTVDANGITELEIKGPGETPGIGEAAIPVLHDQVMEKQSAEVDGVTGASLTSTAVRSAVAAALKQAESVGISATGSSGSSKSTNNRASSSDISTGTTMEKELQKAFDFIDKWDPTK